MAEVGAGCLSLNPQKPSTNQSMSFGKVQSTRAQPLPSGANPSTVPRRSPRRC